MKHTYKLLHAYIDGAENVYLVSTGESKKYGGICEIDYVVKVEQGYSDNHLLEAINEAFDKCYSITPNENENTGISKFMGYKSYSRAIKGMKCILIDWERGKGYSVTSTTKKKREGYSHLEQMYADESSLAEAIKTAIQASSIVSELLR